MFLLSFCTSGLNLTTFASRIILIRPSESALIISQTEFSLIPEVMDGYLGMLTHDLILVIDIGCCEVYHDVNLNVCVCSVTFSAEKSRYS